MNDTTISKRQRSYTLFLLVIVFTASHVDRQIVAILQEPIKQAFQISDTQLGLLTGFMFALFYATLEHADGDVGGSPQPPQSDRFFDLLWSAMTVFCGMAVQFWQLPVGSHRSRRWHEAGSNPPSHSIISDLYKPEERATAMAIFGLGVNFGIMLGYLIGGWVNEWIGWRWAFVVAGVPGLIIAVIVRWTMVEPPRGYSDGLVEKPQAPPFWSVVRHVLNGAATNW